ncbi:lysophospholipid acyltransferase family protein [Fodinibius sp.]|uniref:lysophospholipid acyltransferase family protein n=1 Tax=Fodinibius sp. TaxID=1872440 RepID=UPI003565E145
MTAKVRGGIRLIAFFTTSLVTVLLVAAGNLSVGMVSRREAVRWKNTIIGYWAWMVIKITGMYVNLKGTPPESPFFLVSNHLSYMDIVPLWLCLDGTFVAKSEVRSWLFFGWATRTLGVIFIDRNVRRDVQRVNALTASAITEDQGVIVFPEGTSSKGASVKPFHASLLEFPASSAIPVSYTTITYRSYDPAKPADTHICWWGEMPFFSHFWELLTLTGFEATITFGEKKMVESDRKMLANRLRQAVADNFRPVVGPRTEEQHTQL